MSAGVTYESDFEIESELYAVDSGYRLKGGFNLVVDGENLTAQSHVPTLCPLKVDFAERKAYVVKNIRVIEDAASGATSIKIAKGSFAKVGLKFMASESVYIEPTAIDTASEDYDVLTVAATTAAITAGTVMTECTVAASKATAVRSANALNYARTKIEAGATVTALGRAFEIKESELPIPVTVADKASLTDRFMFC